MRLRDWWELQAQLRALAPPGSPEEDEKAACHLILDKAEMDNVAFWRCCWPLGPPSWVEAALLVVSDEIPF